MPLDFTFCQDPKTNEQWLETSLTGKPLLTTPQLTKGTAFTEEERSIFGLRGKLPARIETLDEQVRRAYHQYLAFDSNLKRNIYLNSLHDQNHVIFYALVSEHLTEMMPMIYTPIVGTAVKKFSQEFRQPRGLYISYPDIDHIDEILDCRSNPEIDLIVVTDGEGVLGIGDQGVGGMDIPIAKLMVYTLCAGINPARTLPIHLDVGTNNQELLNDPFYLGWHHPRISTEEYDYFVERFINALKRKFPRVFLHWEDFGRQNARRFLDQFRNQICTFNDDIQGTGAVALAGILSACTLTQTPLSEQNIVIFGAGTAGTGIADQLYDAMVSQQGIEPALARSRFWLIDRHGLLETGQDLTPAQEPYAKNQTETTCFERKQGQIDLEEVVKKIKPGILIGCSSVSGAFTESIIRTMAMHHEHPIILPLSNPTERAEATPIDIFKWTKGQALVATGSPFADVEFNQKLIPIAQCNNALVFPGIGLGILAVQASHLSDKMLWAATSALAEASPLLHKENEQLLPRLKDSPIIAKKIAKAVALQAIKEGCAHYNDETKIDERIEQIVWKPHYLPYRYRKPMR